LSDLTRRDFLKFSSVAVSVAVLKPFPPDEDRPRSVGLGRVTDWRVWAYHDPRPGARREVALTRDAVVDVLDVVSTEGLLSHNSVWNLTKYGWLYSSWVQPVERKINAVVERVPANGFWAEVSVPFAEMRAAPNDSAAKLYRLYYSSVHLVTGQVRDDNGDAWYQIKDDQYESWPEFVRAEALRPVQRSELTPISPFAKDKRLEVSLKEQKVFAYEGDQLVWSTRCATGAAFTIEGMGLVDFTTPIGEHAVVRKRPARHMMGFLGRADEYDLPGVPYCTYFTQDGAAVHGAYWHNDFGHPRSHGCVNVLAQDAKWVYRWTMPVATYDDALLTVDEGGTPIKVI
jgi:lipoprotein-anchoring transpeptidase ErfK/SrfK